MEILGATASGIAIVEVVAKLGAAVFKLKELCDDMSEVPARISELLDRLSMTSKILNATAKHFEAVQSSPEWDHTLGAMCIEHCHRAMDDLNGLVAELSQDISSSRSHKRHAARLKAALKRDKLEAHELRLFRALQLLDQVEKGFMISAMKSVCLFQDECRVIIKSSIQESLDEYRSLQGPRVFAEIKEHSTDKSNGDTHDMHEAIKIDLSSEVSGGKGYPRATSEARPGSHTEQGWPAEDIRTLIRRRNDYSGRFKLPRWLGQRAWDFRVYQESFKWTFQLRPYRVVPDDALVIQYAEEGEVVKMVTLFEAGVASPFDRTEYGETLIHLAASNLQLEVCKLLISFEVDPLEPDEDGQKPVESSIFGESYNQFSQERRACFYDYMLSEDYALYANESADLMFSFVSDDAELFKLFLSRLLPSCSDVSIVDRMKRFREVFWLPFRNSPNIASVIRLLIAPSGTLRTDDLRASFEGGYSILHTVLFSYGRYLGRHTRLEIRKAGLGKPNAFRLLIRELFATCSSDHTHAAQLPMGLLSNAVTNFPYTPLAMFLIGLMEEYLLVRQRRPPQCSAATDSLHCDVREGLFDGATRLLLADVEAAGVDLLDFGTREKRLFVRHLKRARAQSSSNSLGSSSTTMSLTWRDGDRWSTGGRMPSVRLAGLTHGRKARDWTVHWLVESAELAGEFWSLVEGEGDHGVHLQQRATPTPRLPGAWVEG